MGNQATKTAAAPAANAPKPAKPKGPAMALVMDTTAQPGGAPRIHEQIVDGIKQAFTFIHGQATEMPAAVAMKFVTRDEAFKLVDAKGEIINYKRRPTQPEELGAGQALVLTKDQTIAHYDELSTKALFSRAVELPGGEKFASGEGAPDRREMIVFIQEAREAKRLANTRSEKAKDDFTPIAEADDDDAENGSEEDAA